MKDLFLQKKIHTLVLSVSARSFAVTFLMLLSLEPFMSQLWITSQIAIPLLNSRFFFSSIVSGTGLLTIAEMTRQNRFFGFP